jgi:hypothetical protein
MPVFTGHLHHFAKHNEKKKGTLTMSDPDPDHSNINNLLNKPLCPLLLAEQIHYYN